MISKNMNNENTILSYMQHMFGYQMNYFSSTEPTTEKGINNLIYKNQL